MAIASMTGFARTEGHAEGFSWVWEIKSVNAKAFDLRFRLAPGFEALEVPLRALLSEQLQRGALTVNLTAARASAAGAVRVNREALALVAALAAELVEQHGAAPPRADGLLALRGVLESGEGAEEDDVRERRQAALLASARQAIDRLVAVRREEGARLHTVLEARLGEIDALTVAADATAVMQPDAIKARLEDSALGAARSHAGVVGGSLRPGSGAARRQGRRARGVGPPEGACHRVARFAGRGRRGRSALRFPVPGTQPRGQHAVRQILGPRLDAGGTRA